MNRVRPRVSRFTGDDGWEATLTDTRVFSGPWYYGRKWLTDAKIKTTERRWVDRCYASRTDDNNQCGGCAFYAAFGSDWGVCWNAQSEHDGRIVFEHGGCPEHEC